MALYFTFLPSTVSLNNFPNTVQYIAYALGLFVLFGTALPPSGFYLHFLQLTRSHIHHGQNISQ